MREQRAIVAPAVGALLLACQATREAPAPERVPIGDILWYVDYEAGLEVAREQDKALWVHFGENPG